MDTSAPSARFSLKFLRALIIAAATGCASGALPAGLMIDETSLADLIAGNDVCGVAGHEEACLRVTPCEELDGAAVCTAGDPVWIPDRATTGEKKRTRSLFRAVLPLDAGPHANVFSLKEAAGRVVSAPHMFMLPRALALYSRKAGAKAHEADCGRRLCLIPEPLLRAREKHVAFPTSKMAVSGAGPLPSLSRGSPPLALGSAPWLGSPRALRAQGFGNLYDLADVELGLRREDILFSWCELHHL